MGFSIERANGQLDLSLITLNNIFKKSCISCHGQNLEGGARPHLQRVGLSMYKQDIVNQIINGGGRCLVVLLIMIKRKH
jgi:alcohol dehydrogenase (cytochrome c)